MTKQQDGQADFQPEEVILVKLGEIVLKGLNRSRFENILMKNQPPAGAAGEFQHPIGAVHGLY